MARTIEEICILGFLISGIRSSCIFPDFLQSPSDDGSLKPWSTRMWWLNLRHIPRWVEKQDVFVDGAWVWRHRDSNFKTCDRVARRVYHKSNFGHCSERRLVYNRTCLASEGYNKFRVVQYDTDRTHRFTCMKFLRRSENVVQVLEGPLSDTNDPDLCDDENLSLDEWPWIGSKTTKPYFCPLSGGFTFRTTSRLTNEDFCEDDWRRSRLEVECISGDGLDFIAPKNSHCNPFLKQGEWKRLSCWAGWENENFIFVVAADVSEKPRYCLRFPKNMDGHFSVLSYFSVICPEEPNGKPPHGIEYYEMHMHRRDPSKCEDDDHTHCREAALSGACAHDVNMAAHCRKACGMCHKPSSSKQKCWFDAKLHGDWRLYDRDRTETVTINRNHVSFSKLGVFACRERGRNENQYLAVSEFKNGCTKRYTCVEFHRKNNNVLQYRIGRSVRKDMDMDDLCSFHEDPFPLGDTYRTFYYKNLVLARDLWPSYCGLDSTIPFNGTFNGEWCEGTVSDWDEDSCTTRGTIILRSNTCSSLLVPAEFQCLSYIKEEERSLQQLLITRSMDGRDEFNCWSFTIGAEYAHLSQSVVTSFVVGGRWPWRVMYQMATTQCSFLTDVEVNTIIKPKSTLYLEDRSRTKICKPVGVSPVTVSPEVLNRKSTDRGYMIQNPVGPGVTEHREPHYVTPRVETVDEEPYVGESVEENVSTCVHLTVSLLVICVVLSHVHWR